MIFPFQLYSFVEFLKDDAEMCRRSNDEGKFEVRP
jgi:hypothetical protein